MGVGGVLVVSGAALAAGPATPRYVDSTYHYSFQPPAGWTQQTEGIPRDSVAFVGTREHDFAPNVSVYSEPFVKLDLNHYIQSAREAVAKTKGVTVEGEKRITLGGELAHAWQMHLRLPGRPTVDNRQVYCLHNRRAFVVTFSTLPADAKRFETTFVKLIASFKWEDTVAPASLDARAPRQPDEKARSGKGH